MAKKIHKSSTRRILAVKTQDQEEANNAAIAALGGPGVDMFSVLHRKGGQDYYVACCQITDEVYEEIASVLGGKLKMLKEGKAEAVADGYDRVEE